MYHNSFFAHHGGMLSCRLVSQNSRSFSGSRASEIEASMAKLSSSVLSKDTGTKSSFDSLVARNNNKNNNNNNSNNNNNIYIYIYVYVY